MNRSSPTLISQEDCSSAANLTQRQRLLSIFLASSLHALVLFSSFCMLGRVKASPQQLHSRELLLGQWNATLRTSTHHVSNSPLLSRFDSARKKSPPDQRRRIPFALFCKSPFQRTTTLPCRLTFFPNHTFALIGNHNDVDAAAASIYGSWRLYANPYCVTDRFYDQVVLRCTSQTDACSASYYGHCRLTGHFSPMSRRRGQTDNFASARLSHCILLVEQQQEKGRKDGSYGGNSNHIEAQLSASRTIPSRSLVDQECYDATDMELFGY